MSDLGRRVMSVERLDDGETLRARYWQRRGYTLSEIAVELDVDRERVVQTLYWDTIRRRAAA